MKVDLENMIEMIIVSHCEGATDRVADGVLFKEAAKKIAQAVAQLQSPSSLPEDGEGVLLEALKKIDAISFHKNEWSEMAEINKIATGAIKSLPPVSAAVGKEDEQEKLWSELVSMVASLAYYQDAEMIIEADEKLAEIKSKFTLIKK